MNIDEKIKELVEKAANCEKRINELYEIKKNLNLQIRKLVTKQRQIDKILNNGEGADS